ncbi:MAG: hypothetical protein RBU26_02490 [Sphaerochaeta sp.]|jgi:hypothetical protein|uniref:hypothetical protein n=1 Tax=Sphaerochaeta sp. TaxID=1972642 RepID=UPI002A35BDB6|nr:hypothetical protein [Sphaerochaeta sp.]MDX9823790.1 hypothetical protein [Sphaerochaeta sp.]
MRMKFIALLAALVLLPAVLFAVPVVVTWEWLLEDPMVTTFRYQVNGEDDDKWTVVDSSVTSHTERGLDGTLAHTLYLQQSYDGIHFSDSAISVAEPMFPAIEEMPVIAEEPVVVAEPETAAPVAEEMPVEASAQEIALPVEEEILPVAEEIAPVTEEVVAVAEEVVPVAEEVIASEEIAPIAEEPVIVAEQAAEPVEPAPEAVVAAQPEPVAAPVEPVEPPKAKDESRYYTTISLGGTLNWQDPALPSYGRFNLQAGVGLQLNNLMTFNKSLGLGVDVDLMYSPYKVSTYGWRTAVQDVFKFDFATAFGNLDHALTISVAPMLNMEFGKVAFDLGVGGFFTYGSSLATTDGDSMLYGAFAKAALEYKFNKSFSMGVSGKYGFILSEGDLSSAPQFAEGTVYMGFSF